MTQKRVKRTVPLTPLTHYKKTKTRTLIHHESLSGKVVFMPKTKTLDLAQNVENSTV